MNYLSFDEHISYYSCIEKDFFIKGFGYNDFNYIKSIKHLRVQNIYTLHLILNGSGTLILNNKKYHLKEKDIFFIPPDTKLCYYPDDDNKWQYIWFEFVGENSSLYAEKMGLSVDNPIKECEDFKYFYNLIYSIFKKNKERDTGYYNILSLFYKFLDTNSKEQKEDNKDISEMITSYIDIYYYNSELTVEGISRNFNISHSYLCKIFKRDTGTSIKDYIINTRIENAKFLLKNYSLKTKDIAYSVGFKDDIHFLKMFKKITGKTPKEYRINQK